MNEKSISSIISPIMGYSEQEMGKWIEFIYTRIAENLLIKNSISLKSIGTLQKAFLSSEATFLSETQIALSPPKVSIQLYPAKKNSNNDFIYKVVNKELLANKKTSLQFSYAFYRVVEKSLEYHGLFPIGNIGNLERSHQGKTSFNSSEWIETIINLSYKDYDFVKFRKPIIPKALNKYVNNDYEYNKASPLNDEQKPVSQESEIIADSTLPLVFKPEEDTKLAPPTVNKLEAPKKSTNPTTNDRTNLDNAQSPRTKSNKETSYEKKDISTSLPDTSNNRDEEITSNDLDISDIPPPTDESIHSYPDHETFDDLDDVSNTNIDDSTTENKPQDISSQDDDESIINNWMTDGYQQNDESIPHQTEHNTFDNSEDSNQPNIDETIVNNELETIPYQNDESILPYQKNDDLDDINHLDIDEISINDELKDINHHDDESILLHQKHKNPDDQDNVNEPVIDEIIGGDELENITYYDDKNEVPYQGHEPFDDLDNNNTPEVDENIINNELEDIAYLDNKSTPSYKEHETHDDLDDINTNEINEESIHHEFKDTAHHDDGKTFSSQEQSNFDNPDETDYQDIDEEGINNEPEEITHPTQETFDDIGDKEKSSNLDSFEDITVPSEKADDTGIKQGLNIESDNFNNPRIQEIINDELYPEQELFPDSSPDDSTEVKKSNSSKFKDNATLTKNISDNLENEEYLELDSKSSTVDFKSKDEYTKGQDREKKSHIDFQLDSSFLHKKGRVVVVVVLALFFLLGSGLLYIFRSNIYNLLNLRDTKKVTKKEITEDPISKPVSVATPINTSKQNTKNTSKARKFPQKEPPKKLPKKKETPKDPEPKFSYAGSYWTIILSSDEKRSVIDKEYVNHSKKIPVPYNKELFMMYKVENKKQVACLCLGGLSDKKNAKNLMNSLVKKKVIKKNSYLYFVK